MKLIGATAHYVGEKLDDGPIIEQEVARVDHAHGPRQLARIVATSSASSWRVRCDGTSSGVLVHGGRTVVFR